MQQSLSSQKVLFVDCQTTGVNPTAATLLEVGWAKGSARLKLCKSQAFVLKQPDGYHVSSRVSEITGIRNEEWENGITTQEAFKKMLRGLKPGTPWVAHYAKFESSFFAPYLKRKKTRWICTFEIAKRLLPDLSSHSIRAVSGHLGLPIDEFKRSAHHVLATFHIWKALAARLKETEGVSTFGELKDWLENTKPQRKGKKSFLIANHTRLSFPRKPGVYHLKDCNGKVLYVGKATSLHHRVNSYFRGKKTKGSRLNELLAQVADIQIFACETPLEAALLETDTIKKLSPPYNRALKTGKKMVFYCDSFLRPASDPSRYRYGPFSTSSWWLHFEVVRAAKENPEALTKIFEEGLTVELVEEGRKLLEERYGLPFETDLPTLRRWMVRGFGEKIRKIRLERVEKRLAALEQGDSEEEEGEIEADPIPWTPERVARRLLSFMGSAAMQVHQARWRSRLAQARVQYRERAQDKKRELPPVGKLGGEVSILELDHLNVLRSELFRVLRQGGQVTLVWGKRKLTGTRLKRLLYPGYFDA